MLCRVLCVMLFLALTAEPPNDTVIYCGLWRSPFSLLGWFFASIPGINLFPWQIVLILLAPLCLLWPGAFHRRGSTMDGAILVSLASIAVGFLWGWMRGGSAYNAYYQLWRFLLALLFGFLMLSVIRKPRHLKTIGVTLLAAGLVRAGLAIYFYWVHVKGKYDPEPPYMTTHDDSLLFVGVPLMLVSWAITQRRWSTWILTFLLCLPVMYAIVLNGRRLAWLELILVFFCAYVMLPRAPRRRVNRVLVAVAPVLLVYVVVGWGRSGPFFEPIRAIATSGSDADASSLARLEEIRNLMYTLTTAGNPLLGTGWGVPYQQVTGVYTHFGDGWWQYPYMPHNSLMGVVVFSGLVGAFGMWMVVPVSAYLGARGYRGARTPIERAAAMSAVCILPAYGVQCYGDIGIQSFTCGLVLGVVMAVSAKLAAWAEVPVGVAVPAPPPRAATTSPREASWPPPGIEPVPSLFRDRRR